MSIIKCAMQAGSFWECKLRYADPARVDEFRAHSMFAPLRGARYDPLARVVAPSR